MLLINNRKDLIMHLSSLDKKQSLGLVPTMGALHIGHASLVKRAIEENNVVVVSIFVNPTQFNNSIDLEKYPQTLSDDLKILKNISKEIIVFTPTVEEMYDKNVTSKKYNFGGLEHVMEGAFRDGHFDGVGTIVEALLRLVDSDRAYFGEKDFQQLQIIKKLVEIQKINVEVIGCQIVREPHGLAYSSRNERLSKNTRKEAAIIYETLMTAKKIFGTKSAIYVKDWVVNQFESQPGFELEYIEISQAKTLKPIIRKQKNKNYRAFIAVYTENVRLIDNIALN